MGRQLLIGSIDCVLVYLDGEGKINEEGVQYYNNLIDYMIKQGNDSDMKFQSSKILQKHYVTL